MKRMIKTLCTKSFSMRNSWVGCHCVVLVTEAIDCLPLVCWTFPMVNDGNRVCSNKTVDSISRKWSTTPSRRVIRKPYSQTDSNRRDLAGKRVVIIRTIVREVVNIAEGEKRTTKRRVLKQGLAGKENPPVKVFTMYMYFYAVYIHVLYNTCVHVHVYCCVHGFGYTCSTMHLHCTIM